MENKYKTSKKIYWCNKVRNFIYSLFILVQCFDVIVWTNIFHSLIGVVEFAQTNQIFPCCEMPQPSAKTVSVIRYIMQKLVCSRLRIRLNQLGQYLRWQEGQNTPQSFTLCRTELWMSFVIDIFYLMFVYLHVITLIYWNTSRVVLRVVT